MGGIGSGRCRWETSRKTTKDLRSLDVRKVKREGHIAPGQATLLVTQGIELELTWQPRNFGGSQPWFVCPGEECGRRCAILYLKGLRLLCRLCLNLAYPTQRELPSIRAVSQARSRALKLKARLGAGPDDELVGKPPGMHHRTFVRIGRQYVAAVKEWRALWTIYCIGIAPILAERNSRLSEEMERERIEFDL
jgi:hypothetical protein